MHIQDVEICTKRRITKRREQNVGKKRGQNKTSTKQNVDITYNKHLYMEYNLHV
jgi:hypothetical protein